MDVVLSAEPHSFTTAGTRTTPAPDVEPSPTNAQPPPKKGILRTILRTLICSRPPHKPVKPKAKQKPKAKPKPKTKPKPKAKPKPPPISYTEEELRQIDQIMEQQRQEREQQRQDRGGQRWRGSSYESFFYGMLLGSAC